MKPAERAQLTLWPLPPDGLLQLEPGDVVLDRFDVEADAAMLDDDDGEFVEVDDDDELDGGHPGGLAFDAWLDGWRDRAVAGEVRVLVSVDCRQAVVISTP